MVEVGGDSWSSGCIIGGFVCGKMCFDVVCWGLGLVVGLEIDFDRWYRWLL